MLAVGGFGLRFCGCRSVVGSVEIMGVGDRSVALEILINRNDRVVRLRIGGNGSDLAEQHVICAADYLGAEQSLCLVLSAVKTLKCLCQSLLGFGSNFGGFGLGVAAGNGILAVCGSRRLNVAVSYIGDLSFAVKTLKESYDNVGGLGSAVVGVALQRRKWLVPATT